MVRMLVNSRAYAWIYHDILTIFRVNDQIYSTPAIVDSSSLMVSKWFVGNHALAAILILIACEGRADS